MKTHTVERGESIRSVAELYGVPESRILFDNELDPHHRIYPGQTLIIGEPTRTDSVRGGDTPERIAKRNDMDVLTLLQNNPHLAAAGLVPSQPLNIAYDRKNSRYIPVHAYSDTAEESTLRRRLPLVSVLSVQNAALLQSGRVQLLESAQRLAALAREYRTLPILCIEAVDAYGRYDTGAVVQILSSPNLTERFIRSTLEAVKAGGFAGAELLFMPVPADDEGRLTELLLALSGRFEECGLYLLAPWLPNLPQTDSVVENMMDIADFVPIRNYLFDDSKNASPAASLDRIEAALTAEFVPKFAKKLLVGIPTFGIDYTQAAVGYRKRAVSAEHICRTLTTPPDVRFDETAQTPFAVYTEDAYHCPVGHTLCYEDAHSLAAKLAVVEKYGLCGISVCSLAYDIPVFWQLLNQTYKVAKY